MANKKKIATSVAAVAMAAAMLLGGTFAWQSISQTALNEASDIVNPGGRLHDDFNGENKDVYVENFADEPIFARVRLGEYMEIVVNKGMGEPIEKTVAVIGDKTEEDGVEKYNYITFKDYENDGMFASAAVDTEGNPYWTWTTGGETVYMPTFNLNKDSLQADVNGTLQGLDGEVTDAEDDDRYSDYVDYSNPANATKTADEIYDADTNNLDDDGITTVQNQTHTAKPTGTAQLISMEEWLAMNDIEAAAAAATTADDPYGIAPAFAQNETASLHYDKNADDAAGAITDVTEPYGSFLTLSDGSGFSREGYTLVGWNTQPDGSGETYALGEADWMLPEGDTTLYAVWELDDGTGGGTDDEDTQDDEPAYWVYDEDGWVYYSKPIQPHTATGLLLSGIKLNEVMDDSWYYAIQVTGQFITADDLGSMEDGTGFYDTDKGSIPTDNALKLLKAIGVEVPENGTTGDEGGEVETYSISFGDKKAIIGSANTTGLDVSLLDSESASVTEGVTWTVSSDNAEVADGKVKASDSAAMSAVLEKYTLSASVGGEKVASTDLYMYDESRHVLDEYYSVTLDSGSTYCMFRSATSTFIQMDEQSGCVWRYGDDVTTIYQYTHTMNVDNTGLARIVEAVIYNNAENSYDFSFATCPHMSGYAGG